MNTERVISLTPRVSSPAAAASGMTVHLVNPSHLSFGVGVITPRWLFVLAGATPARYGDARITDETLEAFDFDSVKPGDVVGLGIHTGNALRGYEIGTEARARGAIVVYGGIHATLYPEEAHSLGGAHAVVKGDGDVAWPIVLDDAARGTLQPIYEAGRVDADQVRGRALGSDARRALHAGLGPDGARLPEALLVLLGVAHRRPEAAPARRGRGHRRDHRAPAAWLSFRGVGRRQLLPGHADRSGAWRNGRTTPRGWPSCARCAPSGSS